MIDQEKALRAYGLEREKIVGVEKALCSNAIPPTFRIVRKMMRCEI